MTSHELARKLLALPDASVSMSYDAEMDDGSDIGAVLFEDGEIIVAHVDYRPLQGCLTREEHEECQRLSKLFSSERTMWDLFNRSYIEFNDRPARVPFRIVNLSIPSGY